MSINQRLKDANRRAIVMRLLDQAKAFELRGETSYVLELTVRWFGPGDLEPGLVAVTQGLLDQGFSIHSIDRDGRRMKIAVSSPRSS